MLRPFEVEAGAGRMRALGTEFDVRRYDDTVSLVVVEHSVRVITQNNVQAINVEAGQSIEYDSLRIFLRKVSMSVIQQLGVATNWYLTNSLLARY